MDCRQIRDTIAECNIEMHKKKGRKGPVKCIFFCFYQPLCDTFEWFNVVVLRSCEIRLTKKTCKMPLYSSVVYLHSIGFICNRMLYDGTVYNLSID